MRQHDYHCADSVRWTQVDEYFSEKLAPMDEALQAALELNQSENLPQHDVSAMQGKMLALLIGISGASRVLEIGTLGGYSAIWMARALPAKGKVTTIEFDTHHAEIAKRNIDAAGVAHLVDIHVGAALDVLPGLSGAYDFIFIDADKPNNPNYLNWALKLSHSGTVIIGDNVVRGGEVIDPDSGDDRVQGVRRFVDMISENPKLEATAIQTVGEKGWDGFVMARVVG